MSRKDLLLGLGMGLILSSIVFYIGFIFSPVQDKIINDEDIISRAKELNMILANEVPSAQTLSDEDIVLKAKELGMIFESDIATEVNEVESTEDINEQIEETEETTILNSEVETEIEIVDVRILPGSSAISISKTLYDAGIIGNADNFVTFLKQSNKTNTIRAGYFKIPKGSSDQEILKILTTPPKKQVR